MTTLIIRKLTNDIRRLRDTAQHAEACSYQFDAENNKEMATQARQLHNSLMDDIHAKEERLLELEAAQENVHQSLTYAEANEILKDLTHPRRDEAWAVVDAHEQQENV